MRHIRIIKLMLLVIIAAAVVSAKGILNKSETKLIAADSIQYNIIHDHNYDSRFEHFAQAPTSQNFDYPTREGDYWIREDVDVLVDEGWVYYQPIEVYENDLLMYRLNLGKDYYNNQSVRNLYTYNYDEQQNLTSYVLQNWGLNGQRYFDSRGTYYYSNGLLQTFEAETFMAGEWVMNNRESYFYYNDTTEVIIQSVAGGDEQNTQRRIEVYDASNNLISRTYYNWNYSYSDWRESTRYSYTYENGNLVYTLREFYDFGDSSWYNGYQFLSTYTGNDITEYLSQRWDGVAWQNWGRTLYFYDGQGRLSSNEFYSWDGTSWIKERTSSLTYGSGPLVQVTRPNDTEVLNTGDYFYIDPFTYQVDNYDLLFSPDSGANWQSLQTNQSSNEPYLWYLPNAVYPISQIKIQSSSDQSVNNTTHKYFSIAPAGGGGDEPQNYLIHNTNHVQLGVTGDEGFNAGLTEGVGFTYDGGQNALFAGGVVYGTAERGVVVGQMSPELMDDMVNVEPLTGFRSIENYNEVSESEFSEGDVINSREPTQPYGINVKQYTLSNYGEPFAFTLYDFINESDSSLNGLYVGNYMDWDVGEYGSNLGNYDQNRNMVYCYDVSNNPTDPNVYGVIALDGMSGGGINYNGNPQVSSIRGHYFNLISNIDQNMTQYVNDIRALIGSGPFDLGIGETQRVAFAIVAGSDLSELLANADWAISKYSQGITWAESSEWIATLTATDGSAIRETLDIQFGQTEDATDGLDPQYNEYELPPLPPQGAFDARFVLPDGVTNSPADIRNLGVRNQEWNFKVQTGPDGYPIVLEWDIAKLPIGDFSLTDMLDGQLSVDIDMKQQNTLIITDESIGEFKINYNRDPLKATFQCDMTYEIQSGRFNPDVDPVFLRGDFNDWSNTDRMQPLQGNPNIYEVTLDLYPNVGTVAKYKFTYDKPDGAIIWELFNDREYTFTQEDIDNESALISGAFNNSDETNVTQNPMTIKFTVDVNDAVSAITGQPFSSIETVSLFGTPLPLKFPASGWPDGEETKAYQLNDNGTNGDEVPGDGIWSAEVTFYKYSPYAVFYKYAINYGLPTNSGSNDNESGTHFFNTNPELVYAVTHDVFGVAGESALSDQINLYEGDWIVDLVIADAGGRAFQSVKFGMLQEATDGIDLDLGEYEVPPLPPTGVFDFRFILPTGSEVNRDFRNSDSTNIEWQLQFQPGVDGYPITFTWDVDALPEGTLLIQDQFGGLAGINMNMKSDNTLIIDNANISTLVIKYGESTTVPLDVTEGWNLLSIPVATSDMSKTTLFPEAISNAFAFNNGYVKHDSLLLKLGYWLKFDDAYSYEMTGTPDATGNINVEEGWNLIGSLHHNMVKEHIYSEPAGLVISKFFEFRNGYNGAEELLPGKGYWVKTSGAGYLYYDETRSQKIASLDYSEDASLVISDKNNNSRSLYYTTDSKKIYSSELPPLPPAGVFDVRFENNRYANDITDGTQIVKINSIDYPITISVEGTDVRVKDIIDGSLVNKLLKDGEQLVINDKNINKLQVEPVELPIEYTLYQNYPNPFNPSTIIKYGLPEDARVKIDIYNALGQRVRTLIDTQMEAGYHEIQLNANQLASGVYFYRIHAGSFIDTKKMLLVK